MGFRRFYSRGRQSVRSEWNLVCSALDSRRIDPHFAVRYQVCWSGPVDHACTRATGLNHRRRVHAGRSIELLDVVMQDFMVQAGNVRRKPAHATMAKPSPPQRSLPRPWDLYLIRTSDLWGRQTPFSRKSVSHLPRHQVDCSGLVSDRFLD